MRGCVYDYNTHDGRLIVAPLPVRCYPGNLRCNIQSDRYIRHVYYSFPLYPLILFYTIIINTDKKKRSLLATAYKPKSFAAVALLVAGTNYIHRRYQIHTTYQRLRQ